MRFIGVKVEQETSAPPPKKNPGSAPVTLTTRASIFATATVKSCDVPIKKSRYIRGFSVK